MIIQQTRPAAGAATPPGTAATTPNDPTPPSAGKPQPRRSANTGNPLPQVLPMFDKPTLSHTVWRTGQQSSRA